MASSENCIEFVHDAAIIGDEVLVVTSKMRFKEGVRIVKVDRLPAGAVSLSDPQANQEGHLGRSLEALIASET